MFRLKVSHLQALTTFSLLDALPNLGSHSVYRVLSGKLYLTIPCNNPEILVEKHNYPYHIGKTDVTQHQP